MLIIGKLINFVDLFHVVNAKVVKNIYYEEFVLNYLKKTIKHKTYKHIKIICYTILYMFIKSI